MGKYLNHLAIILLLIVFPMISAQAKLLVHKGKRSQSIYGTNSVELQKALDSLEYQGLTEWKVDWKYDIKQYNNICKASNPEVTVNIIVTMPHWANKYKGSTELQKRWDEYYTKLYNHEAAHVKNGTLAGKEIEQSLQKILPRMNCFQLKKSVNKRIESIIEERQQWDKDFDQRTDHGRNQGITYP